MSDLPPPPPHDLVAERALLGAFIVNNAAWDEVADRLSPDDFYRVAHRLIVVAMRQIVASGAPIDTITLKHALQDTGKLEEVGGPAYLSTLGDGVPRSVNVEAYLEIVREKAGLRRIQRGATTVLTAIAHGKSYAEAEKLAEQTLATVSLSSGSTFTDALQLTTDGMARIAALVEAKAGITGIATGFFDLDLMLRGLHPGHLTLIAARPGLGKTALMVNMITSIATAPDAGDAVAVFSLEMGKDELFMRMVAAEARVDGQRLQGGLVEDDELPRISTACAAIGGARLWIDDTAGLSPLDLRMRLKRLIARRGPVGVVFLDYIQLMTPTPGRRYDSRQVEVSAMSRELKVLAKDFQIPIVALCQLSRAPELRKDPRPQLSDLRESGALEQDADEVIFIFRDDTLSDTATVADIAELIIGKQRNGPVGTVQVRWAPAFTRFDNLDRDAAADYRRSQAERRRSTRSRRRSPDLQPVRSFQEPDNDRDNQPPLEDEP